MPKDRRFLILSIITALMMLAAIFLVFAFAPDATNLQTAIERYSQRIFYFHVPIWWVGFLALVVSGISGSAYLASNREIWDAIEVSSVEIGFVFITIGLITGSIWAKPTWNAWWTWDPRLTTAAIGWMLYAAYLMLRYSVDNKERRARFAAVYSLLAFLSVPINFMAIRWWRTIHPVVIGSGEPDAQGGFLLSPSIRLVFFFSIVTFTLLYLTLLTLRVRLETLAIKLDHLKAKILA